MKKIGSKLAVGAVCILLGFTITYQLKAISRQQKTVAKDTNVAQITLETEQLKKQKDSMQKKIDELQSQLKNYESAASSNDTMTKEIVKKLENSRIFTGSVDVQGEGVVIYITPQSALFNTKVESPAIVDSDLLKIINELNASDAEAMSINDIRITSRTAIRNASNYITVNEERISPYKRITIKAIGNKAKLKAGLEFPGAIDSGFQGCDIKYEFKDDIQIPKYNKSVQFEYAKPIKKD
ncbi:DUF881 domain-containing protein [Clostridium sp. MB40-C1]|uniref:DUF881 domain-containing protein n=1 Tax=Clostridium sp. MB40-C1 TaxID=3070996 RepID=UPI0027E18D0D|nr:DUF881 domain-containing protein [Clostridium sp. MB40-C1]WMJ81369.1 DUF881 domain-containing protein [Clostridium sp. MB40-C1]